MRKKLLILLGTLAIGYQLSAQSDTSLFQNQAAIPVITLSESDFDGGRSSNDISGLLQSSRDIFVSTAGFNFGSVRYRIRGLDSENTTVLFNGVSMNDLETGRASFATWGGLNDATRFTEVSNGIGASDWAFGGIGGVTNILTRASQFRKAFNISYAASNRSYNNRIMLLYATGMQQNGWAITLSGSRRWAQQGYVPGTFYDAWSWFVSVEKRLNPKHSLGLIAFAAPNKRGMAAVSVQEAYDLSGTTFYNANWGYQNGKVRNARVSHYNQPMIQLSHYWKTNDKTNLQSTLHSWFGRGGNTALDWNEANDPRPDYYRNLPSYWAQRSDESRYAYYLDQWQNNEKFRQLQWDHFYFANSKNLFTVSNVNGIAGNTVTGNKSKYVVEDRRMDRNLLGLNTVAQHQLNPATRFTGGFSYTISKTHHHKRLNDLLGGDFWLDIDKYSDQEPFTITDASQNDLRRPNRIVKEGDIYGYDYIANINQAELWAQAERKFSQLETYLGAKLSTTTMWRTGNMQNGRFPNNSFGDDQKTNFVNYGLKIGAIYALNGRNYFMGNVAFLSRPPYFRDIYLSPRTRDTKVDNPQNQHVFGADFNYILRSPNIKARITVYHTEIHNDLWTRSYYHEDLRAFVNYAMTNVDSRSQGVELGAEFNLSPSFSAHAVAGHGMHIFTNRPNVTISADNDAKLLATNRTVYLKNYYIGGSPQTIYSAGLRYNSPNFWFAGLTGNFFDNAYLEPNPDNHTKEAMNRYAVGDVRIEKLLVQKKLEPGFTLDFFGGKSWRVKDGLLLLNASINNMLNKRDIVSWGFEQLRTDLRDPDRFPAKYAYMYGTTYFISITYRKN